MALAQTFFYLNDGTGTTWQVAVADAGQVVAGVTLAAGQLYTTAVAARSPTPVQLNDFALVRSSYQLGVTTAGIGGATLSGELTTTVIPFSAYSLFAVLISASGVLWLVQVIAGQLQTSALPLGLVLPKIIYPSGGVAVPGLPSGTLNFLRQPRLVPAFYLNAVRHDTVATAGVRQSILERIESFFEFEMEWIPLIADVAAWKQFMSYALAGGPFDYYPDGTQSTFTTFLLEDTKWIPRYKVPGQYTFKSLFRQQVS